MKHHALTIAWFLMACTVASAVGGTAEDHLAPVDLRIEKKYRDLLERKLFVTPFDYGRALIMPSFEPESAVSLYSRLSKERELKYSVTFTDAGANLWQKSRGGSEPNKVRKIKIQRIDVEIPAHTAQTVREVWLQMLQDTHLHEVSQPSNERSIVLDATTMEFSLGLGKSSPLYGELVLADPRKKKNVKAFSDLTFALIEYCRAAPHQRAAIARRIERTARDLLARLKQQ